MKSGFKKTCTRKLIVALEKYGKANRQAIWLEIAKQIAKPRRTEPRVNLWEIGRLARRFKDKTFVVPGKVLGVGELDSLVSVAALEFSASAKAKVSAVKGSLIDLNELMQQKPKASSLMIVK
jgi:large subunit ribosomal protein L18e